MYRAEEYEFRKDVYTVLAKFSGLRSSGFINEVRKQYNNDILFFSDLLSSTDRFIGQAYRRGKLIVDSTEYFLKSYKKIIIDDYAYLVFVHQEELSTQSTKLFQSISTENTRFQNAFSHYWRDRCLRSVKVLYYRYLLTDSKHVKYDGLNLEASRLLYDKIHDYMGDIKVSLNPFLSDPNGTDFVISRPSDTIIQEIEPAPTESTETIPINEEPSTSDTQEIEKYVVTNQDIPFLSYIYDNIVVNEFPNSAAQINTLCSQMTERQFFDMVLQMDSAGARKALGIGGVQTREVISMCNMLRQIAIHSGARTVFEFREKADLAASFIKDKLKDENIRVIHAFESLWRSCDSSVVVFYMKVISLKRETVKFQGLNYKKSQELYDLLKRILNYIDRIVSIDVDSHPEMVHAPNLIKLGLNASQCNNILTIIKKCGHFPAFATLSCFIDNWANERQKDIFRCSLNSVYGKPVENLSYTATSLGVSRERVRQLREECFMMATKFPSIFTDTEYLGGYRYEVQTDYDYNRIREEEGVDYSNEFITICIPFLTPDMELIGDPRKALFQSSGTTSLYLVPKHLANIFNFREFIDSIDEMYHEKRFAPYRDDLETYIRSQIKTDIPTDDFYAIVKECRQILQKGYPDNIINSQLYFPANTRKTIPYLIEDILREFNRPMTAEDISAVLNERYPDLEQPPSKIGSNALRNSNIIAVSRTSTYTLVEWNYTEKRGGTIRDLAEEYLNSLIQPIAPLTDICDYISKFRSDVKESSVKANLWAESNNRFSVYYKGDITYIGLSEYEYGEEYTLQKKRQGRRSFMDSIEHLENFIKQYGRFPYSSGVESEEARLFRFFNVSKANIKKGLLTPDETAEIERIDTEYGSLKTKKERVSWEERLERFVKYITDNESLPYPSSKEYAWYEENKALYDAGALDPAHATSFSFLVKIVERMS